jgi:hypothetical protein
VRDQILDPYKTAGSILVLWKQYVVDKTCPMTLRTRVLLGAPWRLVVNSDPLRFWILSHKARFEFSQHSRERLNSSGSLRV